MSDNVNSTHSLEDIISLMDDGYGETGGIMVEESEPPTHSDPPTEQDTVSEETENDESLNVEEDEEETEVPESKEESSESTDADNSEDEAPSEKDSATTPYRTFYEELTAQEILSVDEDFEFDGTIDSLETAITQTKKNLYKQAADSLWNQLPEELKPVVNYAMSGGSSLEEFVSTYMPPEVESLDPTKTADQNAIMREYFAKTTQYDNDRIETMVQRLKAAGSLEEDATQALEELKQIRTKELKEFEKRQVEQQKAQQDAEDERRRLLQQAVQDSSAVQTSRKKKVRNFMFNATAKDGITDTHLNHTIRRIASNPDHFIQLADLLMDYDADRGFSFDRYVKKASSQATSSLKKKLEDALEPKAKVKGSAKSEETSFDWEEFLKQN